MTFLDHLTEFRNRFVKSFAAVVIASVAALIFSRQIFGLLQIPMIKAMPPNATFIATTPFESYFTYFKVSLLAGTLAAMPFIFYQVWAFVTPGLKPEEKKLVLPFSIASGFLFTGGALFGYFVVFPTGFGYASRILEGTAIQLMPRMADYFNVVVTLLLAFGITFELPLVIFLLGRLGLLQYNHIRKYRRYVIVSLLFLAALLTPGPDVVSQVLMALPLWILYEVGGLSLFLLKR